MNVEQAKAIRIEDFLARLGHSPVKQSGDDLWYCSPLRAETKPSFRVNRAYNNWVDWGAAEKPLDIIELAKALFKVADTSAALKELARTMGERYHAPAAVARPKGPREPENKLLRAQPYVSNWSLLNYLHNTRRISPQTVRGWLHEVNYENHHGKFFALGFPNRSGGYELRSANGWKGTVAPKDITLRHMQGAPEHGPICVFEGFMDFLTALELRLIPAGTRTVLVLNSAALRKRVPALVAEQRPEALDLFLHNDATGEAIKEYFRKEMPGAVFRDHSGHYAGYKDLNEWHQAQRGAELQR